MGGRWTVNCGGGGPATKHTWLRAQPPEKCLRSTVPELPGTIIIHIHILSYIHIYHIYVSLMGYSEAMPGGQCQPVLRMCHVVRPSHLPRSPWVY